MSRPVPSFSDKEGDDEGREGPGPQSHDKLESEPKPTQVFDAESSAFCCIPVGEALVSRDPSSGTSCLCRNTKEGDTASQGLGGPREGPQMAQGCYSIQIHQRCFLLGGKKIVHQVPVIREVLF